MLGDGFPVKAAAAPVLGHECDDDRGLLDIAGLAAPLGVGERFVRRLVNERRIPFVKVGRTSASTSATSTPGIRDSGS